ncbi:hypothetical protein Tco_0384257, partial [Tanacetum coccineum]
MTHRVARLTLDSARSCVMQSAFLTQGMVSLAIVVAVVLVVVYAIIRIVVVVVVRVPSIIKLLFVITGSLHRTTLYYLIHQPLGYVDGFLQ